MNLSFLQKKIKLSRVFADLPPFFLFLVVAGALFYATLFRWGDLLIDTFRDFYLPAAILDGKVLYRDIYYEYGFFTPYFIAGWFKLFGISVLSLALCGFCTLMAVVTAIYKLTSLFIDKFLACFVGLIFIIVFAFGHYGSAGIFNFILPYSFASTFFITFTVWSLYFFIKFILYDDIFNFLVWGCFLVCAFAARIEFSFLVWIGFFFSFLLYRVASKHFFSVPGRVFTRSRGLSQWAIIFIPLFIAFVAYFIFFIITKSFAEFQSRLLGFLSSTENISYTAARMGLTDIVDYPLKLFRSLLWQLALILCAAAGAFFTGAVFKKLKYFRGTVIITVIVFFCITAFVCFVHLRSLSFLQYNAVPVMLSLGGIFSIFNIIRGNKWRAHCSVLTLEIVSLLLLLRVFFNVSPHLYSFFLIVPGVVGYYVLFYWIVGDILQARIRCFYRPVYVAILSIFFTSQALFLWSISYGHYQQKTFIVKSEKGTFFSDYNPESMVYWLAVDYLEKNTKLSDTVLVVPEGIGINFFAGRKNPTPYLYLHPSHVRAFGEEKIIGDLRRSKVDCIIFCARNTAEQGSPYFGFTYAKNIYAWILGNYTLVRKFGPYPFTSSEFGIAVFKRKN